MDFNSIIPCSRLFKNMIYPFNYGDVKNQRYKRIKRKIKSKRKRKRILS